MINLTEGGGTSHDIFTEYPPWIEGIFVFLQVSIIFTFFALKNWTLETLLGSGSLWNSPKKKLVK
jgi:hypothetical protein